MRTSYRPMVCLRVLTLLPARIQEILPSFGDRFKAGGSVMIYKHLGNTMRTALSMNISLTMTCAPLSHISLANALRAKCVGKDVSMNADNASVSWPSDRRILSSSLNDFCHETFRLPMSTSGI